MGQETEAHLQQIQNKEEKINFLIKQKSLHWHSIGKATRPWQHFSTFH